MPHRGQHQPAGADRFSPMQRQHAPRHRAGNRQCQPAELFEQHVRSYNNVSGYAHSLPLFISARSFDLHAIATVRLRSPALMGV